MPFSDFNTFVKAPTDTMFRYLSTGAVYNFSAKQFIYLKINNTFRPSNI